MAHQFKVGDWVIVDGSPGVARQIEDIGEMLCMLTDLHGSVAVSYLRHVRVILPKPRRKLTLSQGLAWMHDFNNTRINLHLNLTTHDDKNWVVYEALHGDQQWHGVSPCKSIIEARRALGVK